MKKTVVILFAVVLILLSGCGKQIAISGKTVEDYTSYKGEECYLTLPYSKQSLHVWNTDLLELEEVDLELLWEAEKKILKEIPESEKGPVFYIGKDKDGNLCLKAEVIVALEPPIEIGENANGYVRDHDHLFFSERITK